MAEIKTPPVISFDKDGNEIVCFHDKHTLSDITRWLMQHPVDAEEVRDMLSESLKEKKNARSSEEKET